MPSELRPRPGSGHLPTLVASLGYFEVCFMVWLSVGALAPYISSDLALGPSATGLLVSMPVLGASVLRLVVGTLADTWGAKRTAVASCTLLTAPMALAWAAGSSLLVMLVVAILLGLAGSSVAVAIPLVSRWYPQSAQGLVLGIVGAGNSGTVLAGLLGPRVADALGWRNAFLAALVPLSLASIGLALFAREAPGARPQGGLTRGWRHLAKSCLSVASHPDGRVLATFYAVSFGGFVGFVGYLPTFLVTSFSFDGVSAGILAAGCGLAGSVARPVGGWLADRLGGVRVLTAVYSTVAVALVALSRSTSAATVVALMTLSLGSLGIGNGAVFQLLPSRFPERLGAATGLVAAAGGLGGFVVPSILGGTKAITGSYSLALQTFALLSTLTALSAFRHIPHWRSSPETT